MNGAGDIRSIGFRDDRSPPYWPHLNAHRRGDTSLGRQIASPLDSIRSPRAALSPISSRVFPITGARVSSLYRDRRQPPRSSLSFAPPVPTPHVAPRVRDARVQHVRTCKRKDAI